MDSVERLRHHQALIAPGTALREGLERIVHGRTGALIVLGDSPAVQQTVSGGFAIDVELTPSALRELAKLDGGIVLSSDLTRIVRAGVHFVPRGDLPTAETGTRHRSADRVAQQTGTPVVTVSASMSTISLFMDGQRHLVEATQLVLVRTNQALTAMFSHRQQALHLARLLNVAEIQDQASVADVARLAQRLELQRRLRQEVDEALVVLGVEGRLLGTQAAELTHGLRQDATWLAADYVPEGPGLDGLRGLSDAALLELGEVATAFGFGLRHLDDRVQAHGYRQVHAIPRMSEDIADRVLGHFDSLQSLLGASIAELSSIEGISPQRARAIRDGLMRMSESALNDPLNS